jgi:hypothetical protein
MRKRSFLHRLRKTDAVVRHTWGEFTYVIADGYNEGRRCK